MNITRFWFWWVPVIIVHPDETHPPKPDLGSPSGGGSGLQPEVPRVWWTEYDEIDNSLLVSGGFDKEESLYVARAPFDSSFIPGKFHWSHGSVYYPLGGRERSSSIKMGNQYLQARPGSYFWKNIKDSNPEDMVIIGGQHPETKEQLGSCRVNQDSDNLVLGWWVIPAGGICRYSYNYEEMADSDFQILVLNPKSNN